MNILAKSRHVVFCYKKSNGGLFNLYNWRRKIYGPSNIPVHRCNIFSRKVGMFGPRAASIPLAHKLFLTNSRFFVSYLDFQTVLIEVKVGSSLLQYLLSAPSYYWLEASIKVVWYIFSWSFLGGYIQPKRWYAICFGGLHSLGAIMLKISVFGDFSSITKSDL